LMNKFEMYKNAYKMGQFPMESNEV
jgi:hypothetical protein